MRTRACICTMLLAFCHVRTNAQTLTIQLPASSNPRAPGAADTEQIPIARPLPQAPKGVPVTIHAREQEKRGATYDLRGEVEIDYKNYVVRADHITYNTESGELLAEGHLEVDGGPDNERISASRGVLNLDADTGTFFDVIGSVGIQRAASRSVYTTPNPFLITGEEFIQNGPDNYEVIAGSMTSCRLPRPHWRILAPRIVIDNGTGKAWNSNFRLLGYPILYLPYVTHAVNTSGRQSGFMIPELETGSAIKGTVIGDTYYWAINRSADLTFGLQWYSLRGFEQNALFRFRGRGNDFIRGQYSGLEDRGLAPSFVNQGGQDTLATARHDFTPYTRAILNGEYLSSYTYRQVFAENFAQAVSSEVKSWGFVAHEKNGLASSFDLERYQNFASSVPGDEIRILHLPTIHFDALDHPLGGSDFIASGDSSFSLLSRSEPYYRSYNIGRIDLFPHISMPWIADGWTFRPTLGLRETAYSHSQILGPVPSSPASTATTVVPGRDAVPTAENGNLNRKAIETDIQILPPVLERDFSGPWLEKHFGVDLRHTIEPEVNYRYVAGIDRFNHVPRFDPIDIYSNTNEVEYGLTQRLFLKRLHPKLCTELTSNTRTLELIEKNKDCGEISRQWLSWFIGQKYFADPTFGNAVIPGRRNIFTTTLDFSGIAYITSPRSVSPIVSRLRIDPSSTMDLEWDFDYDTKAGRIAASNVFANYRSGNVFSSLAYSVLNAVGETPVPPTQPQNFVNYDQAQALLGYGALTKRGLSAAASGGFDLNRDTLEYGAIQATYNFDCCGFTVEYRRFNLGVIRNESQESFSFTLAGVGNAGNLKRAERLF